MHGLTNHVRPAESAGEFYPAEPARLRRAVAGLLRGADTNGPIPKALIVPHAAYCYSGSVAASGFALLKAIHSQIKRVVLLGPAHKVPFFGLAASSDFAFATPLGTIPLDAHTIEVLLRLPQVHLLAQAHRREHSLEVQLPFLQMVLGEFSLVPFTVGQATEDEVADVLEHVWDSDEVLVVVSSDLSHFYDYWTARGIDSETSRIIERCQWNQLTGDRACGYRGIRGLLKVAEARHLSVKTIDLRNSGDTAGSEDRVVGYGSFVVY